MSVDIDLSQLKPMAQATGQMWIFPDDDLSAGMDRLRKKNFLKDRLGIPDKIEDAGMPGIDSLIPQKPPFVMIDRLVHVGENSAIGELRVNSANVLADNGFLREPGLIEFMAQTAAAYTGYRKINEDEVVKEGYIGSVKNQENFSPSACRVPDKGRN